MHFGQLFYLEGNKALGGLLPFRAFHLERTIFAKLVIQRTFRPYYLRRLFIAVLPFVSYGRFDYLYLLELISTRFSIVTAKVLILFGSET